MPQPITELVEAARIVTAAHASLLVQIGDVGHLRPQSTLYIGAAAARDFQLAELPREIHLPLVVKLLAAEHQDRVAVDGLPQHRDGGRIERMPDIDAADLADKQRV